MTEKENLPQENPLKLRAHHISCIPYMRLELPERGDAYYSTNKHIASLMRSNSDLPVTICAETDMLCYTCPYCKDKRCANPEGDEDEVRKLDSIMLVAMGAYEGDTHTVTEWHNLVMEKAPFRFCRKCRHRDMCNLPQIVA